MRTLLHSRMGHHLYPYLLSKRPGTPRAQRLYQWCNLHALHDERTLYLRTLPCILCGTAALPCESCYVQHVKCPHGSMALAQCHWVAHHIMASIDVHIALINILLMVPVHQPWRLDRCNLIRVFLLFAALEQISPQAAALKADVVVVSIIGNGSAPVWPSCCSCVAGGACTLHRCSCRRQLLQQLLVLLLPLLLCIQAPLCRLASAWVTVAVCSGLQRLQLCCRGLHVHHATVQAVRLLQARRWRKERAVWQGAWQAIRRPARCQNPCRACRAVSRLWFHIYVGENHGMKWHAGPHLVAGPTSAQVDSMYQYMIAAQVCLPWLPTQGQPPPRWRRL